MKWRAIYYYVGNYEPGRGLSAFNNKFGTMKGAKILTVNLQIYIYEIEFYCLNYCIYVPTHTAYPMIPPALTLTAILRSAHTVYLCVLCGSENKQRLFPYATLTDCFM